MILALAYFKILTVKKKVEKWIFTFCIMCINLQKWDKKIYMQHRKDSRSESNKISKPKISSDREMNLVQDFERSKDNWLVYAYIIYKRIPVNYLSISRNLELSSSRDHLKFLACLSYYFLISNLFCVAYKFSCLIFVSLCTLCRISPLFFLLSRF